MTNLTGPQPVSREKGKKEDKIGNNFHEDLYCLTRAGRFVRSPFIIRYLLEYTSFFQPVRLTNLKTPCQICHARTLIGDEPDWVYGPTLVRLWDWALWASSR